MAFGLAPESGSFTTNQHIVGGIVTGSSGEYLALPISATVLGGLSDQNSNTWSRFYLSSSFSAASSSIIQALNYLKASGGNPSEVSGAVKFNTFTHKILANENIESSASVEAGTTLVAGTTVSGAGAVAGASLTTEEATISVAGVVSGAGAVQGASLTTEEASISVAGVFTGSGGISGQSLTIANLAKISDGGILSSSVGATLGNLRLNDDATSLQLSGNLTTAGVISSSAGATFLGPMFTDDVNVSGTLTAATFSPSSVSGAVKINIFTHKILSNENIESSASLIAKTDISGAGMISGQALTIGNSVIVSDAKALTNLTTISGASSLAGAKLTINNSDVITQAGAVAAPTTVSGAGAVSGQNLVTEEATISAAGVVSGAGQFQGSSLSVGNGAGQVTVGGQFVGTSFQGGSVESQVIKASQGGAFSGTVGAPIVASATGTVNGSNHKAAFYVSSSDISTAGDAALIPRMVIQGTNDAGTLKDFMITVSGGLFQVTELTHGTALPV